MSFLEGFEINISLGGFAEDPEDIDGDERDFECFNRCLADDYYSAFYDEDYELIGEIDDYLLSTIANWYTSYDGVDHTDEIKQGLMKTINNRTFAETVIEDKKPEFAEIFAYNGNTDINLIVTVILYGDYLGIINEQTAPDWLYNDGKGIEYYINEILNKLSVHYESLDTTEEKLSMLNKVSEVFKHTKVSKENNNIHLTIENEFVKALRNSLIK